MFGIGGTQIIIVVIGLVIFGAMRLPELGKRLGTGIRKFKKGTSDLHGDLEDSPEDKSLVLTPESRQANEVRR